MNILIAEDDLDMQKILKMYLLKEGHTVNTVSNGKSAIQFLSENQTDLIILDWMMPIQNGIETCKEIRFLKIPIKILMLTAKGESEHEVIGLSCGADDYLRKPFDIKVLLLRIKKLCKTERILQFKDISLNQETSEVMKGNKKISLTKTEFDLLNFFLTNQRIILSREKLLINIWGMDFIGSSRTVDTHIRRLRKKIGENYIQTKVGMGYTMENQND